MLHLHTSNRFEQLAEGVSELVMRPASHGAAPLFQADQIVVQNPGMQHWLSMALARRYGIAMNLEFPLLARALWALVRQLVSDVPEHDRYCREVLLWRIYALLPQVATDSDFAAPTGYWCPDGKVDALKRFALARELADLFEQYLMYRPEDFIQAWERGEDTHWQARLWRLLVAQRHEQHSLHFMSKALERLGGRPLERGGHGLPARLLVVGVNTMPPVWIRFLQALARHIEVHLFLLVPSEHYWLDQASPRQRARERKAWLGKDPELARYPEDDHPLIGALGRQGQEFLQLLYAQGANLQEHDACVAPAITTLLSVLQRDLYELFDRRRQPVYFPHDGSLLVMNCHSPLREIQSLHDWLLHRFNQADVALTPADVLVLCPRIEQYAPYIQSVFGSWAAPLDGDTDNPRLPASLADRAARDSHPLVQSFLDLLGLPDSRLRVSDVLGQMRVPAVLNALGLTLADIERIEAWLQTAGIHWGLDSHHKACFDLPQRDAFTWAQGLHRLLAGFAMSDEDILLGDQVLVGPVEGADARVLGQLVHFIYQLQATRNSLPQLRTAAQWVAYLHGVLEDFYDPGNDEDTEYTLQLVREGIGSLLEHTAQADLDEPLPRILVQDYLQGCFSAPISTQNFMTGKITFCSTLPMRSIPFRIIAVLGLNDGEFPRLRQPLGFDLMAERGRKQGDRSRRDDDRYLFLETLLSARDALYLSYCGRAVKDNAERQPSLVLAELLAYLSEGFGHDADEPEAERETARQQWLAQLVLEQPLQPFSERRYQGAQPSFDEGWLKLLQRPPAAHRLPEVSLPEADEIELELETLVAFFDNPAQAFCEKQLGVYFTTPDEDQQDTEPFSIDALTNYGLKQDLVTTLLDDRPVQQCTDWHLKRGLLPDLPVTRGRLDGLAATADSFTQALRNEGVGAYRPQELEWHCPPFRLRGRVLEKEGDLLGYRPGKRRPRDLVRGWLSMLLAQACGIKVQQMSLVSLEKDNKDEVCAVACFAPPENPAALLQYWLDVWQQGQRKPLLVNANFLLPKTPKVADYWETPRHSGHDTRCPYHCWLWPAVPAESAYQAACEALYTPLLDHFGEANA